MRKQPLYAFIFCEKQNQQTERVFAEMCWSRNLSSTMGGGEGCRGNMSDPARKCFLDGKEGRKMMRNTWKHDPTLAQACFRRQIVCEGGADWSIFKVVQSKTPDMEEGMYYSVGWSYFRDTRDET